MSEPNDLIQALLADPVGFEDLGRANELLKHYFAGFPLSTLQPLLRSQSIAVQRNAAFVASELGARAEGLVDDVLPLLHSPDRLVKCSAAEVVAVCCRGPLAAKYSHLVNLYEGAEEPIRGFVRKLMNRADPSQQAVIRAMLGST